MAGLDKICEILQDLTVVSSCDEFVNLDSLLKNAVRDLLELIKINFREKEEEKNPEELQKMTGIQLNIP